MICTEEQRNVLEELFVEALLWSVNQLSVNPIAVWKTYVILKLPNRGYLGVSFVCSSITVRRKALLVLHLLLNACLMNPDSLTPSILHLVLSQRHPRMNFLNN